MWILQEGLIGNEQFASVQKAGKVPSHGCKNTENIVMEVMVDVAYYRGVIILCGSNSQ